MASALTAAQLADLARQAGFQGDAVNTIVAIALAESGGRPDAYNGNESTGDNSVGLTQINMIGKLGADRQARYGWTKESLKDPLTNMKAAYTLSGGGKNFSPWTTYTSGAYRGHLGAATATGGGGTSAMPTEVTTDPAEYARTYYGALSWLLDDPEVGPILRQAGAEHWTAERVQAALQQTNYWKSHSKSLRDYETLQHTDPAEFQRQFDQKALDVGQAARLLGVSLTPDRLHAITDVALRLGWDDAQLRVALAHEVHYQPGGFQGGDIGAEVNKLRAQAFGDYMVPISDQTLFDWAQKIAAGDADEAGFTTYITGLAKGRWSGLAGLIDQGVTPGQFFDPYKQQAAQILEMDPSQVDLMNDPRFTPMTEFVDDKGFRRPRTLSEAGTYLRGLPQWRNTQGGNQVGSQLLEKLLNEFGAVAS